MNLNQFSICFLCLTVSKVCFCLLFTSVYCLLVNILHFIYCLRIVCSVHTHQVLEEQDGKLRLVHTQGWSETHWKTKYSKQWVWFQKAMLILVLLDAIVMATRSYYIDEKQIYSCYLFIVSIWQVHVTVM